MVFTLEALKAAYGDALLLHFGKPRAPRLAVIDGGPRGVYLNILKPRLEQLRRQPRRLVRGRLPIRLLMVSHIDDDHVNGVLELAKDLTDQTGPPPYAVESLWHNSLDDILGNGAEELAAALQPALQGVLRTGQLPAGRPMKSQPAALVMASVTQGRDLREAARRLAWDINKEFGGKLIALRKAGARQVPIAEGLTLTVLGPTETEVKALSREWDRILEESGLAIDPAKAAAYADTSVFNLSSIVVLAQMTLPDGRTRRMLLTGDARGDRILKGLKQAGLLADGRCHVDLLKLPHHGSNRNLEPAFFQTVTADHYVISSNGDRFDNPDRETLEWLVAARKGTGPFTVYLTYPPSQFKFKQRVGIQQEIQAFIDAGRNSGEYTVVCPTATAPSVCVDLGAPLEDD